MSNPVGRPKEGKSRAISTARPGERVPLHRQNIIHADTRPGYVRRLVNDTEDRIERFQRAGWYPVEGEQIGDEHAGDPSSMGSSSVKSVGGGMKAILMEIPEDLYNEDQADKQTKVTALEEAMDQDIKNKLGDSSIGEGIKIQRK